MTRNRCRAHQTEADAGRDVTALRRELFCDVQHDVKDHTGARLVDDDVRADDAADGAGRQRRQLTIEGHGKPLEFIAGDCPST